MGDIVSFPFGHEPRRPDARERSKRMRARVKQAVDELEERDAFTSNDLVLVPRNMWQITKRVRNKYYLSQEEIYSCTSDGSEGTRASKNARYYEAPPGAAERRPYTKHPKKYFDILRHISKRTKEDFLDLVNELLDGTDALQSAKLHDDHPKHIWSLIELIDLTAAAVERACDLRSYFRRLGEKQVSYDVRADRFFPMVNYDTLVEEIQFDPDSEKPWEVCSDEAPPWPNVILFRERLTSGSPGVVVYSDDAVARIDRAGRRWATKIPEGVSASEISVNVSLWMEARLTLAPVAPSGSVKPMFELRFATRLATDEHGLIKILNEYLYWDGSEPNIGAVLVDNAWSPAVLQADISEDPIEVPFSPSEFCYFLYLPVTPEVCRLLLDRLISSAEFPPGGLTSSTERLSVRSPLGTLSAVVEHFLINPEKAGFDLLAELKRDANDKIARFAEVYQRREREIDEAHERARVQLQAEGASDDAI